jgi:hypothetical protein
MKARIGSAIVAIGAFAAINNVSLSASAQNAAPAPASPTGPGAPTPPTTTYPTTQYQHPMGEQRTEFLRPNPVLLGTGALTALSAYVPGFIVALGSDHDGDDWLYAPLIGPWLDLATRGCGDGLDTPTCGTTGFETAALIGSGVVQAIGAAQLVAAFTLPQRKLESQASSTKPRVNIAPTSFGRGAQGIMAFGTF